MCKSLPGDKVVEICGSDLEHSIDQIMISLFSDCEFQNSRSVDHLRLRNLLEDYRGHISWCDTQPTCGINVTLYEENLNQSLKSIKGINCKETVAQVHNFIIKNKENYPQM